MPSNERVVEFNHHIREWKKKTTKTPELFCTHFIEAYKGMLHKEGEGQELGQEEGENNAYISEEIQSLLIDVRLGQVQPIQQQHMNMSIGTSEIAKMLDIIARLTNKVSALDSRSNQKERKNIGNRGRGTMTWRSEPSNECKPLEKDVDGKKYRQCQNCRQGKGMWISELGLHGTS